ncbi:MAG TPA: M23 family metallopeptidase, partial [Acidobacteriota bacterium]|nr:M23 family metallopeptidase [Acidobacteriota bacterium]
MRATKKRKMCTLFVASRTKLWRISLTYPLVLAASAVALVAIIVTGTGLYHYCRMILKVKDYSRLLTENDSFRSENHNYRIQTAQLGEKIDFLETLARKLEIVSGMEAEKGVGGIGGFSSESFSQPLPASAGTLKSIDRYNKSLSVVERQYRAMGDVLSRKVLVDSATPDRMPVHGYVSGAMGKREDPFNSSVQENHSGLDISAPYGSPIHAPADGVIIYAGRREGYGN